MDSDEQMHVLCLLMESYEIEIYDYTSHDTINLWHFRIQILYEL